MESTSTWQAFLRLFRVAQPPKGLFIGAVLISLLQAMASLAIPLILQRVVDNWSEAALDARLVAIFVTAFLIQVVSSAISILLATYRRTTGRRQFADDVMGASRRPPDPVL
ncbi:hypothetical protein ABKJ26_06950 [Exiguobacterium mexicanum]